MAAGCGAANTPLWTERALAALAYREDAPFDAGFADARPDQWKARAGAYAGLALTVDSPALVFWIDVLGHRAGDRQLMRLLGPDGAPIANTDDAVEEAHIQWFQFLGAKRPAKGWPPGRYRGEYSLVRNINGQPQTVIAITRAIDLQ
jgi:hypothetical protein